MTTIKRKAGQGAGEDDSNGESCLSSSGLIHSKELHALNLSYSYPSVSFCPKADAEQRSGILSRLRQKVSTKIRDFLFKEYFEQELEYQANLVRCLNAFAEAVDTQRLRRDDTVSSTALTWERQIDERCAEVKSSLHSEVSKLSLSLENQNSRLETLEAVAKGLERIISCFRPLPAESESQPSDVSIPDLSYVLLENRFRGSEEEIASRLKHYLSVFHGTTKPILEIGAGRGELQELFLRDGLPSYGIELDQAMCGLCRDKGLDVRLEEGLSHLRSLADGSLGGVVAIQVVEHLSKTQIEELLRLCRSKVTSGGRIALETINTESVAALARNYFRDPTHVWPLHPETMRYLVELAGLRVVELRRLSPFPQEAVLQRLQGEDFMTPRWNSVIETINHNMAQLNDLLFGHQDYCIIAEV